MTVTFRRRLRALAGLAALTVTAGALVAQEPAGADSTARAADTLDVKEMRRQIDAITRQLEELQLGREVVVQADTTVLGLGPAASKVYKVQQGVSIGGYGEMLYENFASETQDDEPSGEEDRIDFLRAVLYTGYKFNDKLLFNSELEVEHASIEDGGEVAVEFAYLDYRFTPHVGARAGLLLSPMGFLNELHEPPTFLGTERPETERRIIPSTWRENGIGLFGDAGGFSWRGYVMNGFDAVGSLPEEEEDEEGVGLASAIEDGDGEEGEAAAEEEGGFSEAGLAGGRQNGADALSNDWGGVGRLEYVGFPGLRVGGSLYLGNSGQGVEEDGESVGAFTSIYEGHVEYRAHGFDLRGLVAVAQVDDVAQLNELKDLTGDESIGEQLVGWYLQGGYDVLRGIETEQQLIPYVRWEELNTQDDVPAGFSADPANDRRIVSLGMAWKPIANVAVKADYNIQENEADTGVNQLNAVVSYLF
jgi:hypothetical protein